MQKKPLFLKIFLTFITFTFFGCSNASLTLSVATARPAHEVLGKENAIKEPAPIRQLLVKLFPFLKSESSDIEDTLNFLEAAVKSNRKLQSFLEEKNDHNFIAYLRTVSNQENFTSFYENVAQKKDTAKHLAAAVLGMQKHVHSPQRLNSPVASSTSGDEDHLLALIDQDDSVTDAHNGAKTPQGGLSSSTLESSVDGEEHLFALIDQEDDSVRATLDITGTPEGLDSSRGYSTPGSESHLLRVIEQDNTRDSVSSQTTPLTAKTTSPGSAPGSESHLLRVIEQNNTRDSVSSQTTPLTAKTTSPGSTPGSESHLMRVIEQNNTRDSLSSQTTPLTAKTTTPGSTPGSESHLMRVIEQDNTRDSLSSQTTPLTAKTTTPGSTPGSESHLLRVIEQDNTRDSVSAHTTPLTAKTTTPGSTPGSESHLMRVIEQDNTRDSLSPQTTPLTAKIPTPGSATGSESHLMRAIDEQHTGSVKRKISSVIDTPNTAVRSLAKEFDIEAAEDESLHTGAVAGIREKASKLKQDDTQSRESTEENSAPSGDSGSRTPTDDDAVSSGSTSSVSSNSGSNEPSPRPLAKGALNIDGSPASEPVRVEVASTTTPAKPTTTITTPGKSDPSDSKKSGFSWTQLAKYGLTFAGVTIAGYFAKNYIDKRKAAPAA